MTTSTLDEVRTRARRGIWFLLWRVGIVQALSLATGVFLARWLGPEPFGTLAVAQALSAVFALVGDLGLGAALVQKSDAVEELERHAVFTVQMLLVVALGALVLAAGPAVAALVWHTELSRSLLAPIVLATAIAPYRSLAVVGLERDLRFARIAAIETAEHAAYCAFALGLAHEGWGVAALAGAILARNVVGLLGASALAAWRPRFTTAIGRVKPLLAFGLAQQTSNIVYVVAGLTAPVVVGRYVGERSLGLVLWALGNAERPKPILDVIARVAFPSYARLGATPEALRTGLERTLHGGLLATVLYGGLLAGTAPVLIPLLYTAMWSEAIPYLYVFIALAPVVTATILIDVTFLARGDSRVVRNLHL
ncbi:MAG: oligosaccharide flippase family protein, partial [Planctomycetota bacterium]